MTDSQNRQPAGVPVGGQFAATPHSEAAVTLPPVVKTNVGFAGVAVLDDAGQEPLPAWPASLAPVSNVDYGWDDDNHLEVTVTFGDRDVSVWGTFSTWSGSIEELPGEYGDIPVDVAEEVNDYLATVHRNLLHLTGAFQHAAHAAPDVRATLLGLATGKGEPRPVDDPGDPRWVAPADRAVVRAEQNLSAWFGTTSVDDAQIQDALTDLLHLAHARGLSPADVGGIIHRAQHNFADELENPEG